MKHAVWSPCLNREGGIYHVEQIKFKAGRVGKRMGRTCLKLRAERRPFKCAPADPCAHRHSGLAAASQQIDD